MRCCDCYWAMLNFAGSTDRVCCNKKSENYNKVFSEEELKKSGCGCGESEVAIDYRTLTPWEFAKKYYG